MKNNWPIQLDAVRARPEGKNGRYVAHFHHRGKHQKVSLKTRNLKVAMRKAMDLETRLQGRFESRPNKQRLRDTVEEFLKHKVSDGISGRTHAKYSSELRAFSNFAEECGIVKSADVDQDMIKGYRDERAKTNRLKKGAPIHERTRYTSMMILICFFRWAEREGLVAATPLRNLKIVKPAFRRLYAPPLDMVNQLIDTARPPLAVTIATLAFTGMRAGELQLLTRASIDLDQRWITVETLKAKLTRVRPLRRVPIHDRLLPLLRDYLQERKLGPTDNVFNSRNMKLIDLRRLNEQVKALAASLSIPVGRAVDGLVVHSFRHFFETQAVNSNIPQQVIDTWLGHTSDRSMGAHYYRLSDGDSHTMMARVQF